MARSSFISHTVNGYSRYDVPESKAFTCTPGILYPVRIDFINARDRVSIAQGIDVRSNPLSVPTFNPYTVRLHRFWVPLQLYHPEMRTNSSKFDMNNLSLNYVPCVLTESTPINTTTNQSTRAYSNSLMSWLRIASGLVTTAADSENVSYAASLTTQQLAYRSYYANADTYLAYWDIVRNYYGYSQWSLYSIAWPASWYVYRVSDSGSAGVKYNSVQSYFTQCYCNLEYLDAYYESQFYPGAVASTNGTYNRANLFWQIVASGLDNSDAVTGDGYPVSTNYFAGSTFAAPPVGQFASEAGSTPTPSISTFVLAHPMAVVPSNPDRFSRMLPVTASSDGVSMNGVSTIPQLAIASRLQEYKDLLGAGGNRFSDWLDTFFASKIEHVDRPKLLFSASQTVNVQVVMNQGGYNNFDSTVRNAQNPLGQMGGSICFNTQLGRKQSYYFCEPGYMIDMLSIRPVYYWAGIRPDYLGYQGSDYFNPIYNDIGYQDYPIYGFGSSSSYNGSASREPCFNEFRASYDEVLGQLSRFNGDVDGIPLYSYWVQQRGVTGITVGGSPAPVYPSDAAFAYYPVLFTDMSQVNSSFASNTEDNFFVNMSYAVSKKSLVNKTFATRLSNR